VGILVQKELWDAGKVRSIRDLKGRSIGVTQLGSTFHFQIGNHPREGRPCAFRRADSYRSRRCRPRLEALKGKQVDAILVAQPFPGAAEAAGFGKVLAGRVISTSWQIAAIFYSKGFAADRARAVAFMKGYAKASRYYFDAALVQKDGKVVPGAAYEEVVEDHRALHRGQARGDQTRAPVPGPQRPALRPRQSKKQIAWWVESTGS
jgi:NitT/TauT family transport system substrate-binding protein